jgi:hypothetical protein
MLPSRPIELGSGTERVGRAWAEQAVQEGGGAVRGGGRARGRPQLPGHQPEQGGAHCGERSRLQRRREYTEGSFCFSSLLFYLFIY